MAFWGKICEMTFIQHAGILKWILLGPIAISIQKYSMAIFTLHVQKCVVFFPCDLWHYWTYLDQICILGLCR